MGNQGRQGDFSGNYQNNASQGWRNNQSQSFGWKQDAGPSNTPYHQQQFPSTQDRTTKLEDTLEKFMQASMANQKNTEASIRNLETQVGQLAKQLADQQGSQFSANTQTNPREYCKSITTRSEKFVGEGIGDNLNVEESGVEEEKNENEGEKEKNREESGRSEKKSEKHKKGESQMRSPPVRDISYPHAPSRKDKDRQFSRFMDILKRLQINIPFTEALEQMPTYVRFMKELLTKKRKIPDQETVELEAGCSAIIQKSLPQKSRDPRSFTLPVTIRNLTIKRALMDLGASINLIPLSMWKKIGDVEVRPTKMTLQLADRSIKYPYGIVEDMIVKVDKILFPIDFVVMDMEEDAEVLLILGRPFIKTAKVIIDVDKGKLKVCAQDEEVSFDVFEAIKHQSGAKECFRMDVLDEVCAEQEKRIHAFDPLMKILDIDDIDKGEEREVQKCWEKFEKARKIPKNNVQRQRRPHGALKLKDPESHMCRNVFAWASRESPGRILQRKNEKNCELQLSPGRERSRPERKLRVLTGVVSPGRERSRPERKLRCSLELSRPSETGLAWARILTT